MLPLRDFVPHSLSLGESAKVPWQILGTLLWTSLATGAKSADVLEMNDLLNAFYPNLKKILPACTASFSKKFRNGHIGLPFKLLRCKPYRISDWPLQYLSHGGLCAELTSAQVLAIHITVFQISLCSTWAMVDFAQSSREVRFWQSTSLFFKGKPLKVHISPWVLQNQKL